MAVLYSSGPLAKKRLFFDVGSKMAVFAVSRSTPLQQRSTAVPAKPSTPFKREVATVLPKRHDDREPVSKALIVELAVVSGCNSSSIPQIGVLFRARNSEPTLCSLYCCHHRTRGRLSIHSTSYETRRWPSPPSMVDKL